MAKKGKTNLRLLAPYFLGGLGVTLMVIGISVNYFQTAQRVSPGLKSDEAIDGSLREINSSVINVDIAGAVVRPGVYEMPDNSRVKDVLITAGGLAAKADRNYISKTINLAQRLNDGMKLYFPFEGEVSFGGDDGKALGAATQTSYQINLNTATAAQLDTLPGIGPVTAEKIIMARPYQNISDLINRKVVSSSVYEKIKDRVVAP